jgi:hypothetical protein
VAENLRKVMILYKRKDEVMGEISAPKFLARKPEGNRPLWSPWCRLGDNNKLHLKETGHGLHSSGSG